jgi:drug/metabolite transporter (DMT)-like permease
MAFFLLGEKLSILQYIAIFVLIVASYAMFFMLPQNGKKLDKKERNKYLYILMITSVLLGISSIINKYTLSLVNPYTFIMLTELFIAVNFIMIITIKYKGVSEMLASLKHHKLPIAAIAVLTTVSRITYYIALSTSAVALAQPLLNAIYIVITVIAGVIIFSEGSIAKKLLLCAIILIFAFILVL